jgi:hypothetical protein
LRAITHSLALIAASLLATALSSITAHADDCSCLWRGPFSRAQARADLIVAGEVTAQRGNAIALRVDQTLRGVAPSEVIQVWGAYPGTCRPEAAQFETGSQWVMALTRIDSAPDDGFDPDTPNVSFGLVGDYALDGCGANWLRLRDGLVTGNLTEPTRWQYEADAGEPVLLAQLIAFLRGELSESALAEAARPLPGLRQLRSRTRIHLLEQDQEQ